MNIQVKRVYDKPAQSDGMRVLVDRLWPRGMRKEDASIDHWAKDIAPSHELRAWLHENPEERFSEFKVKYQKELHMRKERVSSLVPKESSLTLVTAVKDIDRSHVPVLKSFLEQNI